MHAHLIRPPDSPPTKNCGPIVDTDPLASRPLVNHISWLLSLIEHLSWLLHILARTSVCVRIAMPVVSIDQLPESRF